MNERHQNIVPCSASEFSSAPDTSIIGFPLPLTSKYPKGGSVWAVLQTWEDKCLCTKLRKALKHAQLELGVPKRQTQKVYDPLLSGATLRFRYANTVSRDRLQDAWLNEAIVKYAVMTATNSGHPRSHWKPELGKEKPSGTDLVRVWGSWNQWRVVWGF